MFVRNFLFTFIIAALAGCAAVPADKDAASPDGAAISTESLGAADTANGPRSLEWCEPAQGALSGARPYQLWAFDGACDDVFIDLASRAGDDMFLILYARQTGGAWEIIDWNDDCYAGTLSACLEVSTDADLEYLVAATTYEYMAWGYPAWADYDLTLSCRNDAGTCSPPTADPTGQFCGGLAGVLCPDDFYCAYAPEAHCGYADAGGTCQRRPDACIQLYDPVCGCDGNTYGNACMAANAGVSVASQGECGSSGVVCGGRTGTTCPRGSYCAFTPEAICGWADATGICTPRPDACPAHYDPVCGCDGRTYSNACMAANSGVSVASEGACERPGQGEGETCGGIAGLQCGDGLICDYSGSGCWADAAGVCVVDERTYCTREYAPVCGCDGVTYSNDCERRANYVGLDHAGAC